jgi:hypothetical protein
MRVKICGLRTRADLAVAAQFPASRSRRARAFRAAAPAAIYGGRFVAETLMPLILELESAYEAAKKDPAYAAEMKYLGRIMSAGPRPLYFAER